MRSILIFSCCLAFATVSHHAAATPVTWCLSDAEFDDGTSATGYFVFDADLAGNAKAVNWSIETEALALFEARSYVPTTGSASVWSGNSRVLISDRPSGSASVQNVNLQTSSPLTNAGGSLTLSGAYECINCIPVRGLTGSLVSTSGSPDSCFPSVGVGTATAVPTMPFFGLLTLGGLLGLFGLRKLKQ